MARPRKDDLPSANILGEVNWNYSVGPGKRHIELPDDKGSTREYKGKAPDLDTSPENKGYRNLGPSVAPRRKMRV